MIREKTVCFTGHRTILKRHALMLSSVLEKEIIKQIENGAVHFRAGGAMGFDTVAALKVIELKDIYPFIKLDLFLPCKDQTKGWSELNVKTYDYCMNHADTVNYVTDSYYSGCMMERNRRLVNGSNVCIAYLVNSTGGTFYTCSYALKNNLSLVNIADCFGVS